MPAQQALPLVLAPSGNLYFISGDVRRTAPTGVADAAFGTSGVAAALPAGSVALDVLEAEDGVLVLIDDAGTKRIVIYNPDGTINTAVGTAGVITPGGAIPPTNPLARLFLTGTTIGNGSGVGYEIPGVALPSGVPAGFTPEALSSFTSGSSSTNFVVGRDSSDNLVIAAVDGNASPTSFASGFGTSGLVTLTHASGTTQVGDVAVDEAGNVYVIATLNGETAVFAFDPAGAPLAGFGDSGKNVIAGATAPGSLDIKDGRIILSSQTATNTVVRALFTPAGFATLPVAVGTATQTTTQAGSSPAPFTGPIIQGPQATTPAVAGGNVTLRGNNLAGVSAATINGLAAEVISATAEELSLRLPAGLAAGVYDLVVTSPQGTVTIQGAIRIQAGESIQAIGNGQWTKAEPLADGSIRQVKIYAKDPVGLGKIQFLQNGREIAWVRAVDETDPKLRTRSNGEQYLVRTVTLLPGKNALEIYIDGERVWRAAYTLR